MNKANEESYLNDAKLNIDNEARDHLNEAVKQEIISMKARD